MACRAAGLARGRRRPATRVYASFGSLFLSEEQEEAAGSVARLPNGLAERKHSHEASGRERSPQRAAVRQPANHFCSRQATERRGRGSPATLKG